jgi:hypothetical protein
VVFSRYSSLFWNTKVMVSFTLMFIDLFGTKSAFPF